MAQKVTRQILKPNFYDKFTCTMSECEDNCCSRIWAIPIDRATFEKYKSIKNPRMRQKLKENVVPAEEPEKDDFFYAQFKMEKQGQCPFHTDEGLCEIHKILGEQFLGSTCRTYPRCHRAISDEYTELSISMSCPEAVRIALFNKAPMGFIMDMTEFESGNPLLTHITRPHENKNGPPYLPYAEQMREAAITIMQLRAFPVAHRIIVIAMMLFDADSLHNDGKTGDVPQLLNNYCNSDYSCEVLRQLDETPLNIDVHRKMLGILYFAINGEAAHPQSTLFAELIGRIELPGPREGKQIGDYEALGISCSTGHGATEIAYIEAFYTFYINTTRRSWNSFLENYEHVLENYFVCYIFTELFPVRYLENGLDPYHHAFLLAQQYAILKVLLCANVSRDNGFNDRYITQTISQVAVICQHSQKLQKVAEGYKNAGLDSLAHLFYLLS